MIGPDFTDDDVNVDVTNDCILKVSASYRAEIGLYGAEVNKHQLYGHNSEREIYKTAFKFTANE